jgi:hypothetical protein
MFRAGVYTASCNINYDNFQMIFLFGRIYEAAPSASADAMVRNGNEGFGGTLITFVQQPSFPI